MHSHRKTFSAPFEFSTDFERLLDVFEAKSAQDWKIFVADFNDPTILNNDIGLVRLENDISFTKFINPLCLPPLGETGFGNSAYGDGNSSTLDTAGLNIVGKNATVIGWGAVNDGESLVLSLAKYASCVIEGDQKYFDRD